MINKIYIATYKYDMRWTRICVSSIRYWYPDIAICLIKDYGAGPFDTSELESQWGVELFKTSQRLFGWGFSKLEPLFLSEPHKFLVLDSDTVFTGPVLDSLNEQPAEFIVDDESPTAEEVKRLYFDLSAIRKFDPGFEPCGKNFNSGQWVGTAGLIHRRDFDQLVEWSHPPRLLRKECFMPGDQGILNYVLEKHANAGRFRLARVPLMWWAARDIMDLDLARMCSASPYTRIIHWAGCKMFGKQPLPRYDILRHFEDLYYNRIGQSQTLRRFRNGRDFLSLRTLLMLRRLGMIASRFSNAVKGSNAVT